MVVKVTLFFDLIFQLRYFKSEASTLSDRNFSTRQSFVTFEKWNEDSAYGYSTVGCLLFVVVKWVGLWKVKHLTANLSGTSNLLIFKVNIQTAP